MAERRMFAKTIIDSDAFLDMPSSSQLLYFHLCMRADDEGFVNKPKTITRLVGCNADDLNVLFMKNFVIPFDSGVVAIKHWRIHNYIQNDRFKPTEYTEERKLLTLKENKSYTLRGNVEQEKSLPPVPETVDKPCCGSNSPPALTVNSGLSEVVTYYQENIGVVPRAAFDLLKAWVDEFQPELIKEAINIAVENGHRNASYIKAILKRCRDQNIKTGVELRADGERKHEQKMPPAEHKGSFLTAKDIYGE